jgi:hypothetical protein
LSVTPLTIFALVVFGSTAAGAVAISAIR